MTIKFYSATWVSTMMLVCNADKLLGLLLGSSDKRGETDLATGEASLGLASLSSLGRWQRPCLAAAMQSFSDSFEVPRPWQLPFRTSVAVTPPWQFGNSPEVPRPLQLPFISSIVLTPPWQRVGLLVGESNLSLKMFLMTFSTVFLRVSWCVRVVTMWMVGV